jgi:PAS domain S-box-containing protein
VIEIRQIRILHVDDEPYFLESSKACLERENSNFSIDTATSTEEGLKLLKGRGYDVVLSDYQMPAMNGLEFLQHLRESGNTIPFIIFTGKGREEVAIEALNKGANHYIQKGGDVKSLYGTLAHVIQETVDKRRAKNALQESEVRYRLISENTRDLIATTTFDLDLIYTYISPSHNKLLGYEPEDLIGKSGFDFIHPDDKKTWLPILGKYARAKVKEFVTRKSSEVIASIEYRVRDKSGKWHILESTVNIIKDELLFISRDITERRQKEEELEESKEKYKTLVENAPIGIYYSDVKGTFLYGNKKAEEIVGYKREELIGKNYFKLNLLDHKGKSKAIKILALNALGKATGPDEVVLNRKDGSKSVVDIYTQMASIEGQKIVMAMVRDVTEQRHAENVIREAEIEYKTIFETTGTAMLIIEEDTTISLINAEFEKLTGYSKEEVEGKKSWIEFFVKEDLAKMKEFHYLQRTNPDAAPRNYEFRGIDKNGDVQDVLITIGIIPDTKKSVAALLDITEQKRAEDAIRTSEERFRLLAENAQDIIYRIRLVPTPKFEYISPAVTDILGYTPEEHYAHVELGFKLVHPDDQHLFKSMIQGEKTALEEPIVLRWLRKDGTLVWIEQHNTPIYDEEGTLVAIEGIARDITERKQMEETLRESEEKSRLLFNSGNDAVFVHRVTTGGISGKIIDVNDATCKILGYTRDELLQLSHLDISAPDELDNVPAIRKKLLGENDHLFEIVAVAKDGRRISFEISAHLFNLEGQPAVLSVARDITERKRAREERERFLRELEAKNTEMERFAYTVSHDLKSPLFAIQGFSSLVREDLEQGTLEKLARDLERVEKAAAKMDRLLNDTLQLSRIGRIANPPEEVSFGTIVEGALEQVAAQIKTSGVDVSQVKDFPTVHVDQARIEEMLVNLIGNSIKYRGEQPSPKIGIGHRRDPNSNETVFFVRDNGIGIDQSLHQRVFELFYQGDKRIKGTGAGLAIVKRIVEVHGGRIWIESEKGKGCTICFTLPMQ